MSCVVIVSGLAALAGLVLVVLRRRRLGRREAAVFQQAVRDGRAPDGIDRAQWHGLAEAEQRLGRRVRGVAALLFVLVVGAAAVGAVLNVELLWVAVGIGVVWVVVGVVTELRLTRYLRRVDRLRRSLA